MHGRTGQQQFGIDALGRKDGIGDFSAIQCKSKSQFTEPITDKEILSEIQKVEQLPLKISKLTILVNHSNDAAIERFAAGLSVQREKEGKFAIQVRFWPQMALDIKGYPDIVDKYYPELGSKMEKMDKKVDSLLEKANAGEDVETLFVSFIENVTKLIDEGYLNKAMLLLKETETKAWDKMKDGSRYLLLRAKALTSMNLGENEEGARIFIEALKYGQTIDKAHSNAALAYLILKDEKKAEEFARKALQMNAENIRAYSILIQISADADLPSLIERVPESIKNHPDIALAIARKGKILGKDVTEKWLKVAIANEEKPDIMTRVALSETILLSISQDGQIMREEEITQKQIDRLNEAKKYLEEGYNLIKGNDYEKRFIFVVMNLGLVNKQLANLEDALKFMNICIELEPSEKRYKKIKAEILRNMGRYDDARKVLEELLIDKPKDETVLLYAEVLKHGKDFDRAVKIIEEYLADNPPQEFVHEGERVLLQIYLDKADSQKAQEYAKKIAEKYPANIYALLDVARAQKNAGEAEEASSYLERAESVLTDKSSLSEIKLIADAWYMMGVHAKALPVYERIPLSELDARTLQKLLNCYYKVGRSGEALKLCREITAKQGRLPFVSEVEADIYESLENFSEAERVYKEYLALYPSDNHIKTRLGRIYLEETKLEEIKKLIDSGITVDDLGWQDRFVIVGLYEALGKNREAFEYAYETRRKFRKIPEVHLAYISFFIQRDKDSDFLKKERVETDCAVRLKDHVQQETWYIIESIDREDADEHELNKNHFLAQQVLGRSVGEKITLVSNPIIEEKGEITDIQSKYVRAFQDSLRDFPRLSPNNPAFSTIPMEDPKDGKLPEGVKAILKHLEKRVEREKEIQALYEKKKMTIGVYSKLTGHSLAEIWSKLFSDPNSFMVVAEGAGKEREDALKLLEQMSGEKKIVIDAATIMTLHAIGALTDASDFFGKMDIARSTKSVFEDMLETLQRNPEGDFFGLGGFTKQGDKHVSREVNKIKEVLTWIEKNCNLVPLPEETTLKLGKRRDDLYETMGEENIDAMLLASRDGYVLFSDDLLLRVIAKNEYKIQGFWTQAFLMYLLYKQNFPREKYDEMIIILAKARYSYTAVDEGVLLAAARKSEWLLAEPFSTILKIVKSSDEKSTINLAAKFLYQMHSQVEPSNLRKDTLVIGVLSELSKGKNCDEFAKKLIVAIRELLRNRPLIEGAIIALILQWRESKRDFGSISK